MKIEKQYSLSFSGLPEGIHRFDFQLDSRFLSHFPYSPLKKANVCLQVELEKRASVLILDMQLQGTVEQPCDLCNELFDLPFEAENQLIVKRLPELPANSDRDEEDDVLYILNSESSLYLAETFYELLILSIPIRKVHPDTADGQPGCSSEILSLLQGYTAEEDESPAQEGEEDQSSIWQALKKLKNQ